MSAIVEDGSGKVDAQVYQSEADTATQLTTAGLTAFDSLTSGGQTLALTIATAEGDRIAQMWESENPACFYGHPISSLQALFFPKINVGIPPSIILACSLLAEASAIEDTDTSITNTVPPNVAEVNLSEDVKLKLFKGEASNREASKLKDRARALIESACPRVAGYGIIATA